MKKNLLILAVLFLFSCNKSAVEPVIPEKESVYTFEIICTQKYDVRYTTDLIKQTDVLGVVGNWKYEWRQLPSTHKPLDFQVGFSRCCFSPLTILIKQDGKTLVTRSFDTERSYTIVY